MTTPASSPELDDKKKVLLQSLLEFYEQPSSLRALTTVLRDSQDHEHRLSLRVLDWLCTNYSKSKAVTLVSSGENPFHVHIEYRNALRGVSKRLFDPFARRQRILITDVDGKPLETTLGQMNFMRWCIRHGVLKYAIANAKFIEEDMIACLRKRASSVPTVQAKRRELSKNTLASGHVKRCRVTVTFK